MKLSVVIVNYNVKYYIEQCLRSVLRAIKGIEAEIIIVDNHSHDGSVAYLRERFPSVHIIASQHNLGFARANNLAIRQSKGDYILLLNPDTIVGEQTLHASVAFMDSHPNAGGHGLQMLNDCGSKALESRRGVPSPMVAFYKMIGLCRHFPHHPRLAHYYMGNLSWDDPGKIEVISGAYCFLRRSALDKIGLLDEDFFMYGEDIDLSYRLLQGGFENWYLPTQILHYKGESTQKSSFRYVHVFYDAMLIFFRKHYGGMNVLLSIPIKIAIYTKAFTSFLQTSLQSMRKNLGFPPFNKVTYPQYVCVGRQEMVDDCKQLMTDNGLTAEYRIMGKAALPSIHSELVGQWNDKHRQLCIVYDTHLFSYHDILDVTALHAQANVHLGFYYPEGKKIITMSEIILKQ